MVATLQLVSESRARDCMMWNSTLPWSQNMSMQNVIMYVKQAYKSVFPIRKTGLHNVTWTYLGPHKASDAWMETQKYTHFYNGHPRHPLGREELSPSNWFSAKAFGQLAFSATECTGTTLWWEWWTEFKLKINSTNIMGEKENQHCNIRIKH